MITIGELTDSLTAAGRAKGFTVEQYGATSIAPLIALHRSASNRAAAKVYLSAGAHGDEPAGPNAILRLLEADWLPRSIDFTICPLINPIGLSNGTRENGSGVDLNRDFLEPKENETQALTRYLERRQPFDLSLCLHEDWEFSGFYLYYLGDQTAARIAREMVSAVSESLPIEGASSIDGRDAKGGVIAPPDPFDSYSRPDWPEAFYLYARSHHSHFTTESPSSLPLKDRIAMQVVAVRAAIANAPELLARESHLSE